MSSWEICFIQFEDCEQGEGSKGKGSYKHSVIKSKCDERQNFNEEIEKETEERVNIER